MRAEDGRILVSTTWPTCETYRRAPVTALQIQTDVFGRCSSRATLANRGSGIRTARSPLFDAHHRPSMAMPVPLLTGIGTARIYMPANFVSVFSTARELAKARYQPRNT